MAVRRSQNGYPSYDRSVLAPFVVSSAGRTFQLRRGPCGEMLQHFFLWFDANIRDIDRGIMDDWSYAERPIRGSVTNEDSNHASGTAGDVDATKWPLGSEPEAYLTKAEIAKIKTKLLEYEGCIRWGGLYGGRKDPMHFEIDKDEATVTRVWNKIKNTSGEDGDLMGAREDILAEIGDLRDRLGGVQYVLIPEGGWKGESGAVLGRIGGMQAVLAQILGIVAKGADVDEKALAAELKPIIAPMLADILKSELGETDGLTAEELTDAIDAGLRKVLGSLDAA